MQLNISAIKYGLLLLVLSAFTRSNAQAQNQQNDMNVVFTRTRTLLLSDTAYATEQSYRLTDDVKYDTDADGYYQKLSADGSWPDLDYHTDQKSSWRPSWHMYRIMLLVRAYHKNNDAKYLDAVHRAMAFWIKNDFQCSNWWQNQIDIPYVYSSIILMLDKDANANELAYLDNILVKKVQQKNPTGQNKIWQHDIESRIALIHHDETAFSAAIANMQSVIKISTGEGIQPDYSFQQHGPMMQFGNYGLHFINSLLFWMTVTAKTHFAFDADKQNMMFNYCSNGLRWTVYKGAMDITAIGRQLRENAAAKRGKNLQEDFNLFRLFDNGDVCKYALDGLTDAAQTNCKLNGNKSFWRSDYMVQMKGGNYMMSVKTHSADVKKIESINSENLMGAFLNDGVTQVRQSGDEYRDIEPFWNWAMLPGITCDTIVKPNDVNVFKTNNLAKFVGLVSDGTSGASVMAYDRLNVKANKSYFFVNDMLVCLGSDIESADAKNVVTTVEQCYNTGKVVKSDSKTGPQWVWHNNTGYFFPGKGIDIKTSVEMRKGTWKTVDAVADDKQLSSPVFTLYIPHNQTNSYAYVVKPQTKAKDMDGLSAHLPVTILSNTKSLQAVQSGKVTMAIFYEPGLLQSAGLKIQVNQPCMVIYTNTPGKPELRVSDPSRIQGTINVMVNEKARIAQLPQGDYLGSTVLVK